MRVKVRCLIYVKPITMYFFSRITNWSSKNSWDSSTFALNDVAVFQIVTNGLGPLYYLPTSLWTVLLQYRRLQVVFTTVKMLSCTFPRNTQSTLETRNSCQILNRKTFFRTLIPGAVVSTGRCQMESIYLLWSIKKQHSKDAFSRKMPRNLWKGAKRDPVNTQRLSHINWRTRSSIRLLL